MLQIKMRNHVGMFPNILLKKAKFIQGLLINENVSVKYFDIAIYRLKVPQDLDILSKFDGCPG